ncbi:hypothetical protein Tco_0349142 [Tanacetum coccineum]
MRTIQKAKDKGKAKIVEPKKPLKKKDQIIFDKEVTQQLQAQLDAELEEEKLARQREEDENIAEWDNVQAMMDADYELAERLQAEEQGELTIEEKSRLFVELINKRKKHFARLRAEEQRNMDTELVKGSETKIEGSSKKAGEELESENLKKQKLDENVEAEIDDDQEEAEMKKHMEIVPDDEIVKYGGIYKDTKYPLTPATITEMLNKKLQADHWNEMCYQLLKLMTKQLKNPGSV